MHTNSTNVSKIGPKIESVRPLDQDFICSIGLTMIEQDDK